MSVDVDGRLGNVVTQLVDCCFSILVVQAILSRLHSSHSGLAAGFL